MQIPVSMHHGMASAGLNTELGRMASPTEELQSSSQLKVLYSLRCECTLGTFIENKSFFQLGLN